MCASCGCGCKPGKASKGCNCSCKTCREARTMSVEKSYMLAKALREFDEVEKGLADMSSRLVTRAGGLAEGAKYRAMGAKQGLKNIPFNAKYALKEAKLNASVRASSGADRVRFSRAGSAVSDKISRIKRGY